MMKLAIYMVSNDKTSYLSGIFDTYLIDPMLEFSHRTVMPLSVAPVHTHGWKNGVFGGHFGLSSSAFTLNGIQINVKANEKVMNRNRAILDWSIKSSYYTILIAISTQILR